MNPSFNDITYFLEVANTQNISRAAERLGIAQPSLSSAIKRVEDSIGVPLFVRNRNGVKLTKGGIELLNKSRTLLSSWEQLKFDINSKHNSVNGHFILGCHPSVALFTLSHFFPKLTNKYKELDIQLEHGLSRKITEKIISFEFDFGIVVNPISHPDLVITELCKDEVSFWKTKNKNFNNSDVLICDPELLQSQKLLSELNKKKILYKRTIHSNNLEVVAELTKSGVGVGLLPKRVATKNKGHNLELLNPDLPKFKDRICLVYRADFQKTAAAKEIIKVIREGNY